MFTCNRGRVERERRPLWWRRRVPRVARYLNGQYLMASPPLLVSAIVSRHRYSHLLFEFDISRFSRLSVAVLLTARCTSWPAMMMAQSHLSFSIKFENFQCCFQNSYHNICCYLLHICCYLAALLLCFFRIRQLEEQINLVNILERNIMDLQHSHLSSRVWNAVRDQT